MSSDDDTHLRILESYIDGDCGLPVSAIGQAIAWALPIVRAHVVAEQSVISPTSAAGVMIARGHQRVLREWVKVVASATDAGRVGPGTSARKAALQWAAEGDASTFPRRADGILEVEHCSQTGCHRERATLCPEHYDQNDWEELAETVELQDGERISDAVRRVVAQARERADSQVAPARCTISVTEITMLVERFEERLTDLETELRFIRFGYDISVEALCKDGHAPTQWKHHKRVRQFAMELLLLCYRLREGLPSNASTRPFFVTIAVAELTAHKALARLLTDKPTAETT